METRIRERLRDLASEAPDGIDVPTNLLRRARRRMALIVAAYACVVVVVAAATLAGVRWLGKPAAQPANTPPASLFERVHGWIAVGGSTITAVDPDHPTRSVVLSRKGGIPLEWSRDGTELLVSRASGLYVLRADGTEVHLTSKGSSGGSFSPDGTTVVYGNNLSLYSINASGGTPRPIVTGDEAAGTGYSLPFLQGGQVSPDGTVIAYVRVIDHRYRWGVWLMNADGTGQHEIARLSKIVRLFGNARVQDVVPMAWSPDGTRLAFAASSEHAKQCVIYTIGADGTGLRRVTPQDTCDLSASWSPDESRISFTNDLRRLFTMNSDGTDVREIHLHTSEPPLIAVWNPVP